MLKSLATITAFTKIQLVRSLRDPITLIVLLGIPVLLVLVFGSLTKGTDNLSLEVAVINNSDTKFAAEFNESLKNIEVLKLPEETMSLEQAREEMADNELDGIIELSAGFGEVSDGLPRGEVKVYYDESGMQGNDIVSSVIQSVVSQTNDKITQTTPALTMTREPLKVTGASGFDHIYSIFTGMAIMMVGVFAVASIFPADKKSGALRRLHVTPAGAHEVVLGTMIAYAVIAIICVAVLTLLSIVLFDFTMRGDWGVYSVFVAAAITMMLGFGLAIGGIAKNTTQADIISQIVFLASLSVSGVWFPRALLPEFLQSITAFMPLTPVIEGIRMITTEGVALSDLSTEFAVIGVWTIVVYAVGVRVFKWN